MWCNHYNQIYAPIEDPNIVWNRRMVIADVSEPDALLYFRFRRQDLQILSDMLWTRISLYLEGSHDKVKLRNRYVAPFETCLLLLLFRMSQVTRIRPNMESFFGMRNSHIGAALDVISDAMCQLATEYLDNPLLLKDRFELYANKVYNKCDVLENVWGFIDGTFRQIARPTYHQKRAYSGYKRAHGIKFQSVVWPDGLFGHFYGTINGNRHDSYLLSESHLLPRLRMYMRTLETPFALYGKTAYPQSEILLGGFRNPRARTDKAEFNQLISSVR